MSGEAMSHFMKIFILASSLLISANGFCMDTSSNNVIAQDSVLFSVNHQQLHLDKMKNMTDTEKKSYRDTQYKFLRQKASAIGYIMPETPPWTDFEIKDKTTLGINDADERHKKQLARYREQAADQRKAMQDRLEKQKQSINKRIAKLVEKNAIKPNPVNRNNYPQYQYPQNYQLPNRYRLPSGPVYPRFYNIPPPRPYGY